MEENTFTVSEDIYIMADEPYENMTPDDLRLWLKDNTSEQSLAKGISIANNNCWWYAYDCDEDERYILIYNAWQELYEELIFQGFGILEKENESGVANHDLSDIGWHYKIRPLMERNGFIDGNGWWICDDE